MERFVGVAPSECELVAVGNAINWYGSGADRAGEFVMQADYFSFK